MWSLVSATIAPPASACRANSAISSQLARALTAKCRSNSSTVVSRMPDSTSHACESTSASTVPSALARGREERCRGIRPFQVGRDVDHPGAEGAELVDHARRPRRGIRPEDRLVGRLPSAEGEVPAVPGQGARDAGADPLRPADTGDEGDGPLTTATRGGGDVAGRMGAVDLGVAQDAGALIVGELAAHLARHARDERSRRDHRPLEHDRSPGDEASLADHGAGEDDAAHADQRPVADRAPVHDGVVTDRDVRADERRDARRRHAPTRCPGCCCRRRARCRRCRARSTALYQTLAPSARVTAPMIRAPAATNESAWRSGAAPSRARTEASSAMLMLRP